MLRIGFIFPSSEYLFDPFRGDPHTHFQILTVLEYALGSSAELLLIDLRGIKKNSRFIIFPSATFTCIPFIRLIMRNRFRR